jgi:hypothetical protein
MQSRTERRYLKAGDSPLADCRKPGTRAKRFFGVPHDLVFSSATQRL